MKGNYLDFC